MGRELDLLRTFHAGKLPHPLRGEDQGEGLAFEVQDFADSDYRETLQVSTRFATLVVTLAS